MQNWFEFIGLLVLFVVIVVACFFVTKFIAKRQMGFGQNSNFKFIDGYRISQNKVLQLIKVGDKYFVIAVCKDTVSYLMEIPEEQVVFKNKENHKSMSFQSTLSRFIKRQEINAEKVDINEK